MSAAAKRISLLVSDVDGTLLSGGRALSQASIAAARELREAGIHLAIASGRPPRGLRMLVEPLALDGAIAGFNGGAFVRPDISLISERPMTPEAAAEALRLILGRGLDAWIYTAGDWLVRDPQAPHVAHEAETVRFQPTVVPRFTDAHLGGAVKILGVGNDPDLVARTEREAQAAFGARASATRSHIYYLDVTHPDANKGAVVDTLSRELGIPAEEIATIGDSQNDVLMFRRSGVSIAMGNASEAVRRAAGAVTDTYERDGFAQAVRRLIQQRREAA